jgi:hypothetical protein
MGAAASASRWWWTGEGPRSRAWPELHQALDLLRSARFDVNDTGQIEFLHAVAARYRKSEAEEKTWKERLPGLEKLRRALAGLEIEGEADLLRRKFLEETETAFAGAPGPHRKRRRGRPIDTAAHVAMDEKPPGYYSRWALEKTGATEAEIERAEQAEITWSPDTLAAALFLTGPHKRGGLESLRRALKEMERRRANRWGGLKKSKRQP